MVRAPYRSRPSAARNRPVAPRPKFCYFCANAINDIDYKDLRLLQRFISSYAKISSRRRTGTCTAHQHKLSLAVKRARHMALLPFTVR